MKQQLYPNYDTFAIICDLSNETEKFIIYYLILI